MANIQEKLLVIQTQLKANKSQRNTFGNYNYRSLEDIYEAVKPLLEKTKTTLVTEDDLVVVNGIIFRKTIAILRDTEGIGEVRNQTLAQECLERKGMSPEQCSGSTSSYNTKYCLNKLFNIDDTKDADTDEAEKQGQKPQGRAPVAPVKPVAPTPKDETKIETKPEAPEAPARRRVAVPTEEVKPAPKVETKPVKPSEDQW